MKFLKEHPLLRWGLVILFVAIWAGLKIYSRTSPPSATATQIETMKSLFKAMIDKYPKAIQESNVTEACAKYTQDATPWPEVFQKNPELKPLAALASCTCMTNSLSKTESFQKLKLDLDSGARYEEAVDKYPETTELMMKDCGQ